MTIKYNKVQVYSNSKYTELQSTPRSILLYQLIHQVQVYSKYKYKYINTKV
jgi:hypothetical protein